MKKWYFPFGYDIEKESVNNARIETFRDNILESLARETCQNSIDAALNNNTVEMVFEEKVLNIKKDIDIDSFIREVIPKARKTWKDDKNSQEFLSKYEELLLKDDIHVLRISDYNTTGLVKGNWESLIENAGTSVKKDISSAGSFGIGKAAPFASSDLRMVFYSTRTIDGEEKSIGVTKFISFDNKDGTTAQGVGYLGSSRKEPIKGQISFGFEKRNKPGTDLYIIGFNQEDNWEKEIVASLLSNFLVAIYNNTLKVKVGNTIINKNTMGELINSYNDKEFKEVKNYYSVLENLELGMTKKIYLDKRFEKYGFKPEDGILLISKSKEANRSVLMTRKAGMKILDRKRISGSIQFNGIFHAKGDRFNAILRKMENPNHNNWIPERYTENPKKAEKLLKDMYHFMKENVIKNFQEKIEDQVDAFGISQFLPSRLNNEKQKKGNKNRGLNSQIAEITIKNRNNKFKNQELPTGEDILKQMELQGIIDGSGGGDSFGDGENTEGTFEGELPSGGTEGEGGGELNPKGNKRRVIKEGRFEELDKIKYRIIELDYTKGEYIININPNKRIDRLKVRFKYIGENGSSGEISLKGATHNRENLEYKKDYFILNNINKNIRYTVEFKIPYRNRIKMEVVFYEYK